MPSLIGLAYIQRQRPDSSTAQTCHSALIWPAYIHRAIPDSSTALRYSSSRFIGLGIPQSCRFLIRLRCGIPPADSSIKGFACIPRPRPDRQTRPGLLPRQINCMPLPYYITACILQGLLSLCLSMSACCQLLFKKQHTLSDMHTYQDPYSVFTAFIPRSFLFVRGARTLHAERKQQDARCVLRMARAHNARTAPKTRCRIPPGDT